MKFVEKSSAKEVSISPLIGSWVFEFLPEGLKFSAISVCRVKGKRGNAVFVVGISEYFVFGKDASELWRSPIIETAFESFGVDSIRLTIGEKDIEIGLGLPFRKKVFLHIESAKEFASDPSRVKEEHEREYVPSKTKKEISEERQKLDEEKYGKIVATAVLGNFRSVSLHSKGYVSGVGSQPEKLIAISGEANVVKKSALGRGLGAAISLPLSGFTVSNLDSHVLRGDIYITIVTNVKTHSIHIDMAKQIAGTNPVGEMQKLITTGEALLGQADSAQSRSTPSVKLSDDLAIQLSKLNELYKTGALTENEFSAAKARLLGS